MPDPITHPAASLAGIVTFLMLAGVSTALAFPTRARHVARNHLTEESPMSDRPNPLGTVASKVGVAWSAASGVVGALVTFGVLSSVQGDAITAAGQAAEGTVTATGTVLAGVLPLIAGIVSAFRTASAGRDVVTPVESPMNNYGERLTPEGS